MTKLIVAFRNFSKAPNKAYVNISPWLLHLLFMAHFIWKNDKTCKLYHKKMFIYTPLIPTLHIIVFATTNDKLSSCFHTPSQSQYEIPHAPNNSSSLINNSHASSDLCCSFPTPVNAV
jgi:hypothetical protein